MPQDEANIIIKNSISYILYSDTDNFGWQFNDFRNKLKTCRISDMYDDVDAMFSTCPYFYLKISVRSLLNLFKETEGIEFENVTTNITLLFPKIWDKLKIEERRALGDTYVEYYSKNDTNKISALKKLCLKLKALIMLVKMFAQERL